MEFVTKTSPRLSGEAVSMVILNTNGVGKGELGMVTIFWSHILLKIEASEALATLHQCYTPEPSVFVVKRYTNTPSISRETPGTSTLI